MLIRACKREQGLMLRPDLADPDTPIEDLLQRPLRWAMRQEGAGAAGFLMETLTRHRMPVDSLQVGVTALSEREAAVAISLGRADIEPGARAAAAENGLAFVSTGWECFGLALERGIYTRHTWVFRRDARLSLPKPSA